MRIGFNLPHFGPVASPRAIMEVAQRAEALGYDTLWACDRLLSPVKPQTPFPGTPDGSFPPAFHRVLDPLESLTFAAAHTNRITLGTSVLDMPYYSPVVLARQLTTLDVLSGGRLRVGMGLGWSKDEFDAVGASMSDRGKRADEFLEVLKAIWTTNPVEFHGTYYHVPRSLIEPKPVQRPHPPIYLAGSARAALRRTAIAANGWTAPAGLPFSQMSAMIDQLNSMARSARRDPGTLEVIVRAKLYSTPQPLGDDRPIFAGSLEQIKSDIQAVRTLRVSELFFDPLFSDSVTTLAACLNCMTQIRQIV